MLLSGLAAIVALVILSSESMPHDSRCSDSWAGVLRNAGREGLTSIFGLGIIALGAWGLLATALHHLPLPFAIVSFFAVAAGVAAASPPATSPALADYPQFAGTASPVLGVIRFAARALAAPS